MVQNRILPFPVTVPVENKFARTPRHYWSDLLCHCAIESNAGSRNATNKVVKRSLSSTGLLGTVNPRGNNSAHATARFVFQTPSAALFLASRVTHKVQASKSSKQHIERVLTVQSTLYWIVTLAVEISSIAP